jgi:uncharacterized protein (TIGR02118 family)
MARVVMAYRTPKDTAAFDAHYFETHVPLAKLLPGLRKYEVVEGRGVIENEDFHLVETFYFDDANAAEWALASPQGLAAENDRKKMAPGEDDVVIFLADGCEFVAEGYEM